MSRKHWFTLGGVLLAVIAIAGLAGAVFYYERLPDHLSQHETIVLGQSKLVPGSTAAMRVVVRDSRDANPLTDAGVKVLLKPESGGRALTVFEGETDVTGTLDVAFDVPEDADTDQVLIVETSSTLGSDRVEKDITVERDYRLLVTTDKPLYQPGQVIHMRILALGAFDHRPATAQEVQISVADGKGNTVYRKRLTTSEYGVASVDFQLADAVNTGPYKILAALDNTTSEKTVTIEHYTLPKFEVKLTADRDYYRPGDRVQGELDARYFFGKDVAGGTVVIEGYTFDFERVVTVVIEGETDADGHFAFDFALPDYMAGTDLEDGRARFYVEARVTDLAEHTEAGRLSLPVAQQSLVIDAIPEGGTFRMGVENVLYVLASTPDGAPVPAEVSVYVYDTAETLTARAGPHGLAEVRFTPVASYGSVRIDVRDDTGASAEREFWFEGPYEEESVLLRPDAPIYRVGDTMSLSLLTSRPSGTVYLDIIREGQTVSTRAVDVTGGQAEVAVDLAPGLYGTLELHAYKILRDGHIVRDTRLVVVDQATDLAVDLQPGEDVYRPGEEAVLDVAVTGSEGDGVQSALGIAVVDEAVFALAEQDPGFAKLYFMLEEELLQPKFELHGFSIPEMIEGPCMRDGCEPPVLEEQASAGKAALASALSSVSPFSSRCQLARASDGASLRAAAGLLPDAGDGVVHPLAGSARGRDRAEHHGRDPCETPVEESRVGHRPADRCQPGDAGRHLSDTGGPVAHLGGVHRRDRHRRHPVRGLWTDRASRDGDPPKGCTPGRDAIADCRGDPAGGADGVVRRSGDGDARRLGGHRRCAGGPAAACVAASSGGRLRLGGTHLARAWRLGAGAAAAGSAGKRGGRRGLRWVRSQACADAGRR